ncbi:N-acetyltransferase family protein [Dinoroseobacter sp. S76]|uniref:GNAT family N-acetyltransferase n=1 Tax=Dinoroseobacter sp. S76 TaxID=3415124 RepID=UPI003C7C2BA7
MSSDLIFRPAAQADIPEILALLRDDMRGQGREGADLATYEAAFARMQSSPEAYLIVGVQGGRVVATYTMHVMHGLSRSATTRAQIEAVRVSADLRGQGAGKALMADAETRARAAGACLMQLTSDKARDGAHQFYAALGFTPSHIGFKRELS